MTTASATSSVKEYSMEEYAALFPMKLTRQAVYKTVVEVTTGAKEPHTSVAALFEVQELGRRGRRERYLPKDLQNEIIEICKSSKPDELKTRIAEAFNRYARGEIVLNLIKKIARDAGFDPEALRNIHFHEIRGQPFVLVGEVHGTESHEKFEVMVKALALRSTSLVDISESLCRSTIYEKQFREKNGVKADSWIFGLDEPVHKPISKLIFHCIHLHTGSFVVENLPLFTYSSAVQEVVRDFFSVLLLNVSYDTPELVDLLGVIHGMDTPLSKVFFQAARLGLQDEAAFKKSLAALLVGIKFFSPKDVREFALQLVIALVKKHASIYSTKELAVINNLLSEPKSRELYEAFDSLLLLERRNIFFAKALRSLADGALREIPLSITRVVVMGRKHLDPVLKLLRAPEAAESKVESKAESKADSKAS